MTFEQFNFCLNTVKKGDSLIIGYRNHNDYKNKYYDCINVTREDISYITELLKAPKKIGIEKDFVLIRGHKNKFYDEYGNKVEIE